MQNYYLLDYIVKNGDVRKIVCELYVNKPVVRNLWKLKRLDRAPSINLLFSYVST